CLTVSGGHTQLIRVDDAYSFTILGETIDDAAGEAFDKTAKIIGLPYPGGPLVDQYAQLGNPKAFAFPIARIPGLNFSFSGLKTSFLYTVQSGQKKDALFAEKHRDDLCASMQYAIVQTLMKRLNEAVVQTGITRIALAGGVSANSGLRQELVRQAAEKNWSCFIPPFAYCTDNAAMIAMAGHFKFLRSDFAGLDVAPMARYPLAGI
ncbi:MAG: tRNA (adenosine(37)-N6)-threonylcarbamoyltransferase complex transferase subunit TsaD, partial [Bacteroidia bacterium]